MSVHVDGNAIGGLLIEAFGAEMTDASGTCETCGNVAAVGAFLVWARGPGAVVRCPACGGLLLVLVTIRGITCVDRSGLRSLEAAPPGSP
jgi:hypothetical protein